MSASRAHILVSGLVGPARCLRLPRGALVLPAVLAAACAPRGVQVQAPAPMPQSFSLQGQAVVPDQWWTALGDTRLEALAEESLRGNFGLRMAWDRLDQARAAAVKSGAPLLPALEASAGAAGSVGKSVRTPRTETMGYSLGVLANYELDLWGRVRSTHDAARLDLYATHEDLQAAAITLTAQVAATWYRLIERRRQLRLLDEQLAANQTYLEIITLKFRRGQVSATDVLQQRQLVTQTEGDRLLVEAAAEQLAQQLAVLLGRPPLGLEIDVPPELPPLPELPRTGVPAALVQRRPDVRAAELRVQAADRRVSAAIADMFPKLGLSLRAETSAEQVSELFGNWLASLAANLVAPLFTGGLRRAEVERTRAVVSERLNGYGQIVLTALEEVEASLVRETKQAEYVASLRRQLELAAQATEQTLNKYTKGAMDFTRYLTTLLAYHQLQRAVLQAERDLVLARIDLYRALAGGFGLPRPPRAEVPGGREPVESAAEEQGEHDDPVRAADHEAS